MKKLNWLVAFFSIFNYAFCEYSADFEHANNIIDFSDHFHNGQESVIDLSHLDLDNSKMDLSHLNNNLDHHFDHTLALEKPQSSVSKVKYTSTPYEVHEENGDDAPPPMAPYGFKEPTETGTEGFLGSTGDSSININHFKIGSAYTENSLPQAEHKQQNFEHDSLFDFTLPTFGFGLSKHGESTGSYVHGGLKEVPAPDLGRKYYEGSNFNDLHLGGEAHGLH